MIALLASASGWYGVQSFDLCFRLQHLRREPTMPWKTVLHSVSYAGVWPGQVRLQLDAFLEKAAELGYDGVMLMAKRPHLSLLDADASARRRLRDKLESLKLNVTCLAGYTDFCLGSDRPDIPTREHQILYVTELGPVGRTTWRAASSCVSLQDTRRRPPPLLNRAGTRCVESLAVMRRSGGLPISKSPSAFRTITIPACTTRVSSTCWGKSTNQTAKRCSTPGRRRCTAAIWRQPSKKWRRTPCTRQSPTMSAVRAIRTCRSW